MYHGTSQDMPFNGSCRLHMRIVRLEASHIGGKLAREVKAADMNNLQAVIYRVS